MKREGLFHAENLRPIRFTGMELLTIHSMAEVNERMAKKFMDEDDKEVDEIDFHLRPRG